MKIVWTATGPSVVFHNKCYPFQFFQGPNTQWQQCGAKVYQWPKELCEIAHVAMISVS